MKLTAGIRTLVFLSASFALQGPVRCQVPPDSLGGTGGGAIAGSIHVRVVRAGTAEGVANAFVMVGTMPGAFFPGNYGRTSTAGEIIFTSPNLRGPLMVTAGAEGFSFLTLVSVDANDLVIPLSPLAPPGPLYSVGDAVSGIDVNNGAFHSGDGNIDLAVVLPSMRVTDLLDFEANRFFGPPDTINVLGTPVAVPSNCYIPQQWEIFVEIIKDRYSLFLPAGQYTLAAISGRIPNDAILSGLPMEELLPYVQWRETDVLDVTVTGDMTTADLNVDPDLQPTVTLNLANVPDGGTAYCLSMGDLDGPSGLGRLVPLGMNSLACPVGTGPCSGTVTLTTTPAAGEFASIGYFPAVAVSMSASEDVLVQMNRGPHPQTYTETIASFFRELDLAHVEGRFAWNDVANPADGSPGVAVQEAFLRSASGDSLLWEFMLPGADLGFMPPTLPASAPPAPPAGATCRWEQRSIGLGFEPPAFDFNAFAFSAIPAHASHVAVDQLPIVLDYPAADVMETGGSPRLALQILGSRPGAEETTLAYAVERATTGDLSILAVDGRVVATLARGPMGAGSHRVRWSGRDQDGRRLPSGVYFARLRCGNDAAAARILLLR